MSKYLALQLLEDVSKDLKHEDVVFPTFLDVTFQVRNALKDENICIDKMAKIVGMEPMMSLKIIKMANSVAMNPGGCVISDVKTAIGRVGLEAVRTISFAAALDQLIRTKDMVPFEAMSKRLWEHTSHVAALCRVLAKKVAKINADEAMFAGLVHDIGAFYLMSRITGIPELMANRAEVNDVLGEWHDDVGCSLLTAMKMSSSLCLAVMEHEQDRDIDGIKTLSDVLYLANKIANIEDSWLDPGFFVPTDPDSLSSAIDPDVMREIISESEEEVQSLKAALSG